MEYRGTNKQGAVLSPLSVFALAVLVFSVTRGLVPILTNNGSLAQPAYNTAFFLGVVLSCYGLHAALFTSRRLIGKRLRRLLVINFFLSLYWLVLLMMLLKVDAITLTAVYVGLFPFSVYALIKIPEKILIPTLGLLTLIISAFVILDFISINILLIPGGPDLAFARQTLLRPDSFEAFTLGKPNLYRPNGLLGSMHDSGNMLAMFFVFWLAMLFRVGSHRILTSVVAIAAMIGLLFTQSATNIVAALVGVLFVFAACRKRIISVRGVLPVLTLLLTSIVGIWGLIRYEIDLDNLWAWSARVDPETGDWDTFTSFRHTGLWGWGELFALLFGHGQSLYVSQVSRASEIGILSTLMELGLVHWIVFLILLVYPIGLFFSRQFKGCRHFVIPYVAVVFVGVLSLWHYGSVLRTTNIFVFFALYAQARRIFTESLDRELPDEALGGSRPKGFRVKIAPAGHSVPELST